MKFPGKLVPDMLPMNKISKVKVLSGYRLELQFDDGVSGTVGLSDKVGEGCSPYGVTRFFSNRLLSVQPWN
jgi:hypothetical protein